MPFYNLLFCYLGCWGQNQFSRNRPSQLPSLFLEVCCISREWWAHVVVDSRVQHKVWTHDGVVPDGPQRGLLENQGFATAWSLVIESERRTIHTGVPFCLAKHTYVATEICLSRGLACAEDIAAEPGMRRCLWKLSFRLLPTSVLIMPPDQAKFSFFALATAGAVGCASRIFFIWHDSPVTIETDSITKN